MATLNENIPYFKALVPVSYFTKDNTPGFYNVYCFAIQSVSGKILTFHVMTDDGMLRSRVPISSIYLKPAATDIPFHFKQLWDCFSENVTVTKYDFLTSNRLQVILRDGSKIWATYMFTVDWFDNPYSNEASDYKCGHILVADDGYLLCQPNNRILWKDSNWITKRPPENLKVFKVDTELPSVESVSDKWVSENTDSYYYDINEF
jgi:hypothetical protein